MFGWIRNWFSLRNQITGLALFPALICSIVFGILIFASSRTTARLVGAELTHFMSERTSRACIHGYNTSIVTYGYVMDSLRSNMDIAAFVLAKDGGVRKVGGGQKVQVTNSETEARGTISAGALAIGTWQSSSGTAGPLQAISDATGRDVILFEKISVGGDMMRVAGVSAEPGMGVQLGSYIPAESAIGEPSRMIRTVMGGANYEGTSFEFGSPHSVICKPLTEGAGEVFGMLCVGTSNDHIRSLQTELKANYVGEHGSVVVFYGRGKDRGRKLVEPTGIAAQTESLWFPVILDKSNSTEDMQVDGTIVKDPASGADIVVRYTYFAKWDWVIAIIADSRDLAKASDTVHTEFIGLLWKSFFAGAIALLLAALLSLKLSKGVIDPMADLAIQLTSNATQVASSARHQAANVANLNTSGNEIAIAVKQISATSKELLRAMEQLAADAERTSAVATEGSRGLRGLGSSMESLSAATHSITDQLTTIRAKASKINSVVTAISKVADQTNLLSLNAAIEAEKAGEGGAGFAVVAREIRRLADQSAVSTTEIEQMVEAMQEAVSNGVTQTRELTVAMERGISASESISGQFGDIIQRVESMAPRYEAVHQGMQNQSEGAQQISEAMWQLTETGRQTSDSVNDLNSVSQQLHEAVRILKERIIQIRNAE